MIDDIQLKDDSGMYYDLYVDSSQYLGQTKISLGLSPRHGYSPSMGTRKLNIGTDGPSPEISVLQGRLDVLHGEVETLRRLVSKLVMIRENSNLRVSKEQR